MLAEVMISEKTLQTQTIPVLSQDNNNAFPSPPRLEGKVAIVTGGARGIGEATTRLFVRHGARVVVADINEALGTSLANSLAPFVSFFRCDVSSEQDMETLMNYAVSNFGRVDILVNNAGVLGCQSKRKSILDFDPGEFDRVMSVNVKGAALGIKHFARVAIAKGLNGCVVVNLSSVAGVMGGLGPHAYTASKHAIVGITKNAACELGRYGIRVNCISPFGVATSMLVNAWRSGEELEGGPCEEEVEKMEELVRGLANLRGSTLRAKDIAEAALYLASDESKYVSGHNLVVDGGITTFRNCVDL